MSGTGLGSAKIRDLKIHDLQKHLTRILKRRSYAVRECYYRLTRAVRSRGTPGWLIGTEAAYGGYADGVPVRRTGRRDPRSAEALARATMAGGDRMLRHDYAPAYARRLLPLLDECSATRRGERLTVVEIGVLRGTGLAIWCDLFPHARVVGLDIDLDPFRENVDRLKELGAFRRNRPEVYRFDQLEPKLEPQRFYISEIIGRDMVQVCIDDGHHSNAAVLNTLHTMLPFLNEQFVYFVEDNPGVHRKIRAQFPQFAVESAGELTVVSPGTDNRSR